MGLGPIRNPMDDERAKNIPISAKMNANPIYLRQLCKFLRRKPKKTKLTFPTVTVQNHFNKPFPPLPVTNDAIHRDLRTPF